MFRLAPAVCVSLLLLLPFASYADQRNDPREQAMSDTLDLWREGQYPQLYDRLSHRSSTTREQFTDQLKDTGLRPACCFKKLSEFRLISEKKTTAKVFARIEMEGGVSAADSRSREFTLDHESGAWRMRLADIKSLAGITKKKKQRTVKYTHR